MQTLPLFVLPMVLMPGEIQELRIFEPRYRQMLDDCLLDEKNFGLVLNDPFSPTHSWDGPRSYGCEAEILHHETKGSNHFVQVIGRRRISVRSVHSPALPPFNDPMFESVIEDDSILPDVQELLEMIPKDSEHSKLYISADVDYIEPHLNSTIKQQKQLQSLVEAVLNRIGGLLNIDGDMLFDWVNSSPIMEVIDDGPNSVYSVASSLVDDLESRQLILGSQDIDAAISELNLMFSSFGEEE